MSMRKVTIHGNLYVNGDCVEGCREHVGDGSVDLIITDPPYGIEGDQLHRHYNRDEGYVVDGYVEVPREDYLGFSHAWVRQAERALRPNGQMYVVSGYTNLYDVLDALRATSLREVNHIIWKYNFGVHTRRKYVSSHYHILLYEKPGGGGRTFNVHSRFGPQERDTRGGSLNYGDREDVWVINREYKPGREKNKNELPHALLTKMLQYSSSEGDLVCDMFMGGFSTARVAVGLDRGFVGFELSPTIFDRGVEAMGSVEPGDLLGDLRVPEGDIHVNRGKRWTEAELSLLAARYGQLQGEGMSKAETIEVLAREMGRGRFAIDNALKRTVAPGANRPKSDKL